MLRSNKGRAKALSNLRLLASAFASSRGRAARIVVTRALAAMRALRDRVIDPDYASAIACWLADGSWAWWEPYRRGKLYLRRDDRKANVVVVLFDDAVFMRVGDGPLVPVTFDELSAALGPNAATAWLALKLNTMPSLSREATVDAVRPWVDAAAKAAKAAGWVAQ